jgi:N6-adenosine-specific RNA methylase IME4
MFALCSLRSARYRRAVEPFRLILADPPWKFSDDLPGKTRGAAKNYDVMTVAEICSYALPPIADDAMLLLWRLSSMPAEALAVVRAWGFEPKSEIVWVKLSSEKEDSTIAVGMGRFVRGSHETCIVATRGKAQRLIRDRGVKSVLLAPRRGHSEKPREFYRVAERLFPGPRVELFARGAPIDGWTQYGREAWGRPDGPPAPGPEEGKACALR